MVDPRSGNAPLGENFDNDWKDSVFGEHPEGWDRVREAIAKHRVAR